MYSTGLGTVVMIGVVLQHISSVRTASDSPDCPGVTDTCTSDLCAGRLASLGGVCDDNDEGCQIEGSKVCNVTVWSILDQFPSMQGCVCAWDKKELCASLQTLATQCNQRPVQQRRDAAAINWQHSGLKGRVLDRGSCLKQTTACIHDEVCNKYLVPLVQACSVEQCNSSQCQQATQHFYRGMPYEIAEMLVFCDCEPGDEDCLPFKDVLHSGTCGDEIVTCQEGVNICLGNPHCRERLQAFRAKCWNVEGSHCSEYDYREDECISKMDPALILGGDMKCKMAFLDTVGTALQYPCTCRGLYHEDLQKCNLLHDVLHNRSHFTIPSKDTSERYKPLEVNESAQGHKWLTNHLLCTFLYVLFVGVAMSVTVVVFYKVRMLRRTDRVKFHPPEKKQLC